VDETTKKVLLGIIEQTKALASVIQTLNRDLGELQEQVHRLEHPKEKPWS
jgi:hypothetical protein